MRAQNAEKCDFPGEPPTRSAYVICGTPRTGSGLLCRLLQQTGRMGYPLDYLNAPNLADWSVRCAGAGALDLLLPFIKARRTSPNGVFGIKCFFEQWQRLTTETRVERQLPNLQYVFLTRGDLLAQAVSLARANQTDAWNSSMAERVPPRFDARDVEQRLDEILLESASWEKFFAVYGIAPHRLSYEALREDPGGTARGLMSALGVGSDGVSLDPVKLETVVQRDATSATWEHRIRSRYPLDAIRGPDVARLRLETPRLRDLLVARSLQRLRRLAR